MDFGENIHSYSRKQAIEDGVLIDISELAKECGFKVPVAITSALMNKYLEPDEENRSLGQSFEGRAWDMLFLLFIKAKSVSNSCVFISMEINVRSVKKTVSIKAVIGPGDTLDPVLTIMLPEED